MVLPLITIHPKGELEIHLKKREMAALVAVPSLVIIALNGIYKRR
jgi:hypothetical protein